MFVVRALQISSIVGLCALSALPALSQTLDASAYGQVPAQQAPAAAPSRPGLFTSGSNPLTALRSMMARPARQQPVYAQQPAYAQPQQQPAYAQQQPQAPIVMQVQPSPVVAQPMPAPQMSAPSNLDAMAYGRGPAPAQQQYSAPMQQQMAANVPPPPPPQTVEQQQAAPRARPGLMTSGSNPFGSIRNGFTRSSRATVANAGPGTYGPPPIPVLPAPNYDQAYRLDAGDKLRIVVYGQEGLTNGYAVGASGAITMPLIGLVQARGMTPGELAGSISSRLRDGYIREPSVAVEIDAYRPFFILGEVAAPGQYPYVPNMTVESAVAIAGGFSPRAKRNAVTLTHTDINGTFRITVPPPTPIYPGDTILVGERWF